MATFSDLPVEIKREILKHVVPASFPVTQWEQITSHVPNVENTPCRHCGDYVPRRDVSFESCSETMAPRWVLDLLLINKQTFYIVVELLYQAKLKPVLLRGRAIIEEIDDGTVNVEYTDTRDDFFLDPWMEMSDGWVSDGDYNGSTIDSEGIEDETASMASTDTGSIGRYSHSSDSNNWEFDEDPTDIEGIEDETARVVPNDTGSIAESSCSSYSFKHFQTHQPPQPAISYLPKSIAPRVKNVAFGTMRDRGDRGGPWLPSHDREGARSLTYGDFDISALVNLEYVVLDPQFLHELNLDFSDVGLVVAGGMDRFEDIRGRWLRHEGIGAASEYGLRISAAEWRSKDPSELVIRSVVHWCSAKRHLRAGAVVAEWIPYFRPRARDADGNFQLMKYALLGEDESDGRDILPHLRNGSEGPLEETIRRLQAAWRRDAVEHSRGKALETADCQCDAEIHVDGTGSSESKALLLCSCATCRDELQECAEEREWFARTTLEQYSGWRDELREEDESNESNEEDKSDEEDVVEYVGQATWLSM